MKLRRLIPALALAFVFLAAAPGVALADPISATIAAIAGWVGSLTGVAAFVVNSALYAAGSWAVSKAAQALGLNKNAVQERQAQVTTLSLGETPRELVVGEACTGGTLIDAWNWGGKYGTDYVTRCIALADHLVDRLVGYYVDDQFYAFSANGNQAAFNGALRLIFVNAAADGSNPPADVGASNGGWTNADKVVGVTHVWVVTKVDDTVWTQGHPRFKFVLRGLKAYDPRRDPALGYTGPNPQTWDDPTSHTFTRNAALLDYAYDRGIYATGRQGQAAHLLIGRGLSAEEAPPERIIAAANLCDEIVDGAARYTANGVISAAQSFLEVKQAFASAMAGIIIQPDGGVAIEPGQAKAVVATITDGDLVAGEAKSFSEFLPDTDGGRVNTVVPRYVEPSQGYKDHSGAVRRDLAHLAADGGPRELTLPLLLVTSAKQADRCAEITRLKARLERRATIVLPPDYAEVEEGDWIAWQSARHHGGATVRYRVTSWSLGEDWRQHLTLEEIASSVYGVPDPAPDVTNPPPPPVPVDALQLLGVSAEAITLAGETSTLPAVRFTWDVEVEDTAITAIRAEVRRVGTTEAATTRLDDPRAGVDVVTNGVSPDAALECRLVPLGDPTRPVLASNWITVSTTPVTAGIPPEVIEGIVSDVIEQVDADIGEGLAAGREALDRARDNALLILQNAKNALEGTLKEEQDRETQTEDLQDRIDIGFLIDPIAKTGIIRSIVKVEGLNETFVQMNTRLVARDAENALQTAQVALDAQVYTNDKVAQATASLVTAAQMGTAISGAVLSMQSYADDKVAQATAGLVAIAQMNDAIATSALSLQAWTNGRISEATAGLATVAQLNGAISTATLALQAYTDGKVSEATANLVAESELATALAASELSLRAYTDGQISTATAGLISAVAVDAKIATASLSLSSEIDTKVATATADLISAAELAGAIAGSELSMKGYTDGQISTATALLASKAEVQTRGNAVPNSTGANGWTGWSQHASWATMSDATWGARFETSATGTTTNLSDRFSVQPSATYVLSSDFLFFASGGAIVVDVQWETSDGSVIGVSSRIFTNTVRDYGERKSVQITAPSNASHARIRFFGEAVTGNTRIGIRRIKLERGAAPATAWTDDATDLQLSATAAIALEAATDAATKLSQARLRLVADPGGGQPAVVELFSDNSGSNYIRLAAKQIGFGDSTAFEDATDTLRSETGSVGRITAWGPPFGPDNLVYWEGPAGIATTAATKANAEAAGGQWRDSTGDSYFGGKTLSGPFDSGVTSAQIAVGGSWTTIATVPSKAVRDGYFGFWPEFFTEGSGEYTGTTYRFRIDWRVVSVNLSDGDAEVLAGGEVQRSSVSSGIFAPQVYQPLMAPGTSVPGTKRGNRKLLLQAQLVYGSPGFVSQRRLRGFYSA